MKKYLELSVISALMIAILSCQSAFANSQPKPTQNELAIDSNKVIELSDGSKVREMNNDQQRSLYQIALLSSISVDELRKINAGRYDKKDIVEIGQRLVLPENSPLLPKIIKKNKEKADKYAHLPKLGSDDHYDANQDNGAVATQVASVLQTLASQDWKQITSSENGGVSGELRNRGKDYAENYVRNSVKSQIVDPLRSTAQDFLGRFGTAQLQFDVSDEGHFNNVNVKLFSPWYDSENTLIFSQLSFQEYENNRRIGNFGIGQRFDVADNKWLLGYNVFFDHDFQRSHNRLGLGAEAWTDYMKFAANYYYPLSDWKNSRDFDDYLERAAKGFDIRFQGYLPQYPHLGASLMYEKYFGDEVALFGKDNLQKNPQAITAGIDYTPVPLFTIKAEHKLGQDSQKATKAELTMNYRIGVPLKDQLDPDMVQVARSLKGSRYDLVDRNNYIVLEYKEKKFTVDLSTLGEWTEGTIIPVGISLHNAKGTLQPLSWLGSYTNDLKQLTIDGGDLCYNRPGGLSGSTCPSTQLWSAVSTNDINNWTIKVPPYFNSAGLQNPATGTAVSGQYTLDVTVTNGKGKKATSNTAWLKIKSSTARIVDLIVSSANGSINSPAIADGTDVIRLEGLLKDLSTGAGFHDEATFSNYPSITSGTPITKSQLATINSLWKAKSASGVEITFVDGNTFTSCVAAGKPACLLVKSVSATSTPDVYSIDVVTTAALGTIDVTLNLNSDYTANSTASNNSNSTSIYFSSGSGAARIEIWDGSTKIGDNSAITGTLSLTGLVVGKTYTTKIIDAGGNDVTSTATIAWALVGSNSSACSAPNTTTLPTTGDLFVVSQTDTYTFRGVTAILSTIPQSYASSASGSSTFSPSIVASPRACAGDQGFNLNISTL